MKRARRLAAVGATIRSLLPFSPWGLALTVLAAAALVEGMLRADLASLFWGASFLLYACYALAANHALRFALRRRIIRRSPLLTVTLPEAGLAPGERAEALISARLPRAFPPGFALRVSLPLAWQERRIGAIAARLSAGLSETRLSFTVAWRGAFSAPEAELQVRDLLGFTRSVLAAPAGESLTVFPSLLPEEDLTRLMENAEESAVYARRRRRSEELLEVRKYYPGDDMRRLNWKVFAHLGELLLRVGEEVPPPESRILVVLDATRNPLIPPRLAADYLDRLVEAAASLMAALAARRIEVMLSIPGMRECRPYGEESLPRLLATLSAVWWTDAPWAPELPARRGLHVAVFSSPGSPGLERIMRAARERGWGASLFLKDLETPPAPPRLRLTDMLFLPRERRAQAPVLSERERSGLREALDRDLATYRSRSAEHGAEATHAAEI